MVKEQKTQAVSPILPFYPVALKVATGKSGNLTLATSSGVSRRYVNRGDQSQTNCQRAVVNGDSCRGSGVISVPGSVEALMKCSTL